MAGEIPSPAETPNSSRSTRDMIRESAERSPMSVAAAAGTVGLASVTGLIEFLKAAHEISGATGIIWQVASLVLTAMWGLARYADSQAKRAAQAQAEAQQRAAERADLERQRIEAQQRAVERAEQRDERNLQALHEVVGTMQQAITELKNGQVLTDRAITELTRDFRKWVAAETTKPGVPRPQPTPLRGAEGG